jgi:hypothetical protein
MRRLLGLLGLAGAPESQTKIIMTKYQLMCFVPALQRSTNSSSITAAARTLTKSLVNKSAALI